MAPASIIARVTTQLVAGYDTYGFDSAGNFPEVVGSLIAGNGDYPAAEFFLGGKIVKLLAEADLKTLHKRGVTLDRDPRKILALIGAREFPERGD